MTQRRASTPNILVQPLFPPLAVALGIDYHREASCPQLRNERERTTQKDRRREKAAPSFNVKFTTPRRYAHVNSRSSPRVSQSATPPNDGQGDDRLGRKRERDWGSGSQTSIGPPFESGGGPVQECCARSRDLARPRKRRLSYIPGRRDDGCTCTSRRGSSLRRSWRGGPVVLEGDAMERDEREGALLDVCYLPVLRAAEASTGQSVYRHVPALEQRFACYSTVFRACLSAPQKLARVSTDRLRSIRLNHVESVVEGPAQSSPRPEKRAGRFQSRLHEESRDCREERFTFRRRRCRGEDPANADRRHREVRHRESEAYRDPGEEPATR